MVSQLNPLGQIERAIGLALCPIEGRDLDRLVDLVLDEDSYLAFAIRATSLFGACRLRGYCRDSA